MRMSTKCCLILCGILSLIPIYYPNRHARRYPYIEDTDVIRELQFEDVQNADSNLKDCTYIDTIVNNEDIEISSVYEKQYFFKPKPGGEFNPFKCNALFNTAIIIPYRNRSEQLNIFLNYMHSFLQKQNVRYRIFIVEQNNSLPFNRAKMLNYGSKVAMNMKFSCLVLHDVDLIPINSGNIYACAKKPRHMSSSIDIFRYNLPYYSLFGGAVAILSEQFKQTNGMSNVFYGWGGEDDDFFNRLGSVGIEPCRFSPTISKYIMLFHKKERPSQDRWKNLDYSAERLKVDGLNSLTDNYLVRLEELYTHVVVS